MEARRRYMPFQCMKCRWRYDAMRKGLHNLWFLTVSAPGLYHYVERRKLTEAIRLFVFGPPDWIMSPAYNVLNDRLAALDVEAGITASFSSPS